MIKAIVFDLDGTLLNTLKDLQKSVNFALNTLQFPNISLEDTRRFIGNGTKMLIKRSVPKGTPENIEKAVYETFSKNYDEHCNEDTFPYDGITPELIKLKQDGYKLGVISNKLDKNAKYLVNYHFPSIFDAVQGTYNDLPKKPHPIITNKLLDSLGIKGEEAIYIGDTEVDEECANLGNMRLILVGYGYRTLEELKERCPEYTPLEKTSDIYEAVKKEDR